MLEAYHLETICFGQHDLRYFLVRGCLGGRDAKGWWGLLVEVGDGMWSKKLEDEGATAKVFFLN